MKKLNKLFLALAGISAVSVGLAVGLSNTNIETGVSATGTVSVKRLYVINKAWSEKYNAAAYIWNSSMTSYNSSSWDSSTAMTYVDGDFEYGLFYIDIPTDAKLIVRQKTNSSGDAYQSVDIDLTSSTFDSVWTTQCLTVNWGGTGIKATVTVEQCKLTTTSQMGNVLSYYVTCDNSDVYGYNAYPRLNNTFFAPAGSTITSSTDTTVRDYVYSDTSIYNMTTHAYVNLSGSRSAKVAVADKINAMSTNYSRGSNHASAVLSVNPADSSSSLVLGGIAGVAVLAAGGYFFVRKKKVD